MYRRGRAGPVTEKHAVTGLWGCATGIMARLKLGTTRLLCSWSVLAIAASMSSNIPSIGSSWAVPRKAPRERRGQVRRSGGLSHRKGRIASRSRIARGVIESGRAIHSPSRFPITRRAYVPTILPGHRRQYDFSVLIVAICQCNARLAKPSSFFLVKCAGPDFPM